MSATPSNPEIALSIEQITAITGLELTVVEDARCFVQMETAFGGRRMVEQICQMEHYRREVLRREGRELRLFRHAEPKRTPIAAIQRRNRPAKKQRRQRSVRLKRQRA